MMDFPESDFLHSLSYQFLFRLSLVAVGILIVTAGILAFVIE